MLTYLQQKNLLCHDSNVKLEGRKIVCDSCQNLVLDVDRFVREARFLESCQVAHLYARWTGDVNVLCKIQISDIPGILPVDNLLISYSNLMKGIELLGMTNQEFITTQHHFNKNQVLQQRILENFFKEYMKMVSELQYDNESVQSMIPSLLKEMNSIFEKINVFDYFLNVLCPYVKSCRPDFRPVTSHCDALTPGELLMHLSKNTVLIRNGFSKYCVPFDVIYIMIYCFLCCSNPDVVANFVFDLIARICNGYFDEPTRYRTILLQEMNRRITVTENLKLYYVKNHMQSGDVKDHLSKEFLEKYAELHQIMSHEFNKNVTAPSEQIQQYAFTQTFPYVLFPNVANYNGFMCALGYLTKKMNSVFEKGLFSNAKYIFKTVEEYTNKIRRFSSEDEPVPYWTTDMFLMFLSSDKDLVSTFTDIIKMMSS